MSDHPERFEDSYLVDEEKIINMGYENENKIDIIYDVDAKKEKYKFSEFQYAQIIKDADFSNAYFLWHPKQTFGDSFNQDQKVDKQNGSIGSYVSKIILRYRVYIIILWIIWEVFVNVAFWRFSYWYYEKYYVKNDLSFEVFWYFSWFIYFVYQITYSEVARFLYSKKSMKKTYEYIEKLKTNKPYWDFRMKSYHFVTRERTVTEDEGEGRTSTRIETYQEEVVTNRATSQFNFQYFNDYSINIQDILDKSHFFRLKCICKVIFADYNTESHWNQSYNYFKSNNSRDTHNDSSEYSGCSGGDSEILYANAWFCWLNYYIYVLLCLLNINSIMAILFYSLPKFYYYPILKIISYDNQINEDSIKIM